MTFRVSIISPLKAASDDLARRQQRYGTHAGPETVVEVLNLRGGPTALDTSGDILSSAAAISEPGRMLSPEKTDSILIDCVFDPAVTELQEATGIPTFGPTHTTLPLVTLAAPTFAIIARSQRQCELLMEQVAAEGYLDCLVSVRPLDISYEEAKQPGVFNRVMAERLRAAVDEDGARAIMFGSTTMALTSDLRQAARGVPLFMPGMVALRVMEQLWQDDLWPARKRGEHD